MNTNNYVQAFYKRKPEAHQMFFPVVDMTFAQYTSSTGRRSSILENGYLFIIVFVRFLSLSSTNFCIIPLTPKDMIYLQFTFKWRMRSHEAVADER